MHTIDTTYISSKSFRNFVSTTRFYKVYAPYLLARNTKHKQYNGRTTGVCAQVCLMLGTWGVAGAANSRSFAIEVFVS